MNIGQRGLVRKRDGSSYATWLACEQFIHFGSQDFATDCPLKTINLSGTHLIGLDARRIQTIPIFGAAKPTKSPNFHLAFERLNGLSGAAHEYCCYCFAMIQDPAQLFYYQPVDVGCLRTWIDGNKTAWARPFVVNCLTIWHLQTSKQAIWSQFGKEHYYYHYFLSAIRQTVCIQKRHHLSSQLQTFFSQGIALQTSILNVIVSHHFAQHHPFSEFSSR